MTEKTPGFTGSEGQELTPESRYDALVTKMQGGDLIKEEQQELASMLQEHTVATNKEQIGQDQVIYSLTDEKQAAAQEQAEQAAELQAKLGETSDSKEVDTQYLQHAPDGFKKMWEISSEKDKAVYRKYVEFTVDGPNIIGKSGKKHELAKETLNVSDEYIKSGEINKFQGITFFSLEAMNNYCKKNNVLIPTDGMYLDMLKVMPAGDIHKHYDRGLAGKQLFTILGGKLNGFLVNGTHYDYISNNSGSVWTSSPVSLNLAYIFHSDTNSGVIMKAESNVQHPVFSLRKVKI